MITSLAGPLCDVLIGSAAAIAAFASQDATLGGAAYKLAVIAAGIDHRYRAGGTVGDGFDTAGTAVAPLLERALRQLP